MQFLVHDLRGPSGLLGQRVTAIELLIGITQAPESEASEKARADEQRFAHGGISRVVWLRLQPSQ
jgi:hypothetical protein